MTPLHCAAMHGQGDVVRQLLAVGANIVALDNSRRTPLHWAASHGHTGVVQVLLSKEAYFTLEAREDYGRTPLHFAVALGNLEVVRILLDRGADKESKDKDGKAPLH